MTEVFFLPCRYGPDRSTILVHVDPGAVGILLYLEKRCIHVRLPDHLIFDSSAIWILMHPKPVSVFADGHRLQLRLRDHHPRRGLMLLRLRRPMNHGIGKSKGKEPGQKDIPCGGRAGRICHHIHGCCGSFAETGTAGHKHCKRNAQKERLHHLTPKYCLSFPKSATLTKNISQTSR